MKVTGVKKNPTYRYNPDYAFKGVHSKKPFTIKPGPTIRWVQFGSVCPARVMAFMEHPTRRKSAKRNRTAAFV